MSKLDASIPANNWKIIELYNKVKKEELDPAPSFQRKLVWKKAHKFKFIQTILQNYPFPEIYIAPGKIDTTNLTIRDLIVDGQQRTTTIINYIEGKDVFALSRLPIKRFSQLIETEKADFLNYEVSVRYLKNANEDQIKEIFQRINSTEYSLNETERLNAQWGDSEFICFAKQVIEQDLDIDSEFVNYTLVKSDRKYFLDFFHEKNEIFTENDINRMLALQYMLTLLATLVEGKYFRRNDRVQHYIESYNEEFVGASTVENNLLGALKFIDSLNLQKKSYWFNKANIFSLITEIYKFDVEFIDAEQFRNQLIGFEEDYRLYSKREEDESINISHINVDSIKYFDYAREAVNELYAREHRGRIIASMITGSLKEAIEPASEQ